MSRFKTKQELLDDVVKERALFEDLLAAIPEEDKLVEVIGGMSVKDFLAHRTEWGRMAIRWYEEAKTGGHPAVPTDKYKWNQLKELNAEIHERFKDTPLAEVEAEFASTHDRLHELIKGTTDDELFTKKHYGFTGSSDLATYLNSATASHYRSARRHIQKWWRSRTAT